MLDGGFAFVRCWRFNVFFSSSSYSESFFFCIFHVRSSSSPYILHNGRTTQQNKLKKEEAFMRLNASKIQSEWRDILRKIKTKAMQDDLKAIKKECDEAIQRKNSVIRRLLADLDESEELYSTLLHSHMNVIEKLIGKTKMNATRGNNFFL